MFDFAVVCTTPRYWIPPYRPQFTLSEPPFHKARTGPELTTSQLSLPSVVFWLTRQCIGEAT
jgi:hypothetical protein